MEEKDFIYFKLEALKLAVLISTTKEEKEIFNIYEKIIIKIL